MIIAKLFVCGLILTLGVMQTPESVPDSAVRKSGKKNTKSYALPIGKLSVDPAIWTKSKESNVPGSALELTHDEGDAFLAVVTGPDFIPSNEFIDAFVGGMASGDGEVKDAKLTKRQTVTVNGKQLTDITITALVTNQPFVYRGYLYTGRKGVCLVLIWTHADLYGELVPDIEGVLNGFVVK